MSDPATIAPIPADDPAAPHEEGAPRCPWCSTLLPDGISDRCPSCHANLVARAEERLPGLTEVEAVAATKARQPAPPKRSKLLSWISGEVPDEAILGAPTPIAALEPPSRDVRREILRLTLEAEGLEVAADGSISMPAKANPPTAAEVDPAPPATSVEATPDEAEPGMESQKAS